MPNFWLHLFVAVLGGICGGLLVLAFSRSESSTDSTDAQQDAPSKEEYEDASVRVVMRELNRSKSIDGGGRGGLYKFWSTNGNNTPELAPAATRPAACPPAVLSPVAESPNHARA